jgi:hypothetical protein
MGNQAKIHSALGMPVLKILVLDTNFCVRREPFSQQKPLCVAPSDSVKSVVENLKTQRIGCILVVDSQGRAQKDLQRARLYLKVYGSGKDESRSQFRLYDQESHLRSPVTTIAFALNLMSQGGFATCLSSIRSNINWPYHCKNIVDYIANSFIEDV